MKLLSKRFRMTPPITDEHIRVKAEELALFQRRDCYAYKLSDRCVVYTAGPDKERPSRRPFHIARYRSPLKVAK